MMSIANIPSLGVGLSYRSVFSAELIKHQQSIDFLEIVADHYIDCVPEKLRELELLQKYFTLIPHAINLSLGSASGIDESYLRKLSELIAYINPPYWSEHIAITQSEGIEIGHLSPLTFSQKSVDTLSRNIERVSQVIHQPLILENISYLVKLPSQEMEEAEFLNRLLSQNDCGLLLDLTNLYYNSQNHTYDVSAFLQAIPKDKIVQFHFTGGRYDQGRFIDDHSSQTPEEVWTLMKQVLATCKVKGIILERDDSNPDFKEVLEDVLKAKEIFSGA